jgi:gluconokinase
MTAPPRVLVMGVSGCGKSTIGALVAARLGLPFIDADDLHSAANREKLAVGITLTDVDRQPWLEAVHAALVLEPGGWVLACSALKQSYRDTLTAGLGEVTVVLLDAPEAVLAQRLAARHGHFAAPSILRSQLETLERPANAITVDVRQPPPAVADAIVSVVGSR